MSFSAPVTPLGPPSKIGPSIAAALKRAGIDLIAALPDAWLTELIDVLDQDPNITLIRVAREDEGVGICAGAFLGGRKAALLGQNAGFLLSVNALAGLSLHHHIPILMLLAHRGGIDDNQFFQVYKGRVTEPVLDALHIPHHYLDRRSDLSRIEQGARQAWLARGPVALLLSANFLGHGGVQ